MAHRKTQLQPIKINRYGPEMVAWQGNITPADEAWLVFIDGDGNPSLWERVECEGEGGDTTQGYVCVGGIGRLGVPDPPETQP